MMADVIVAGTYQLVYCLIHVLDFTTKSDPIPINFIPKNMSQTPIDWLELNPTALCPLMFMPILLIDFGKITVKTRGTMGSPAYGQIGLQKVNLFTVHLD